MSTFVDGQISQNASYAGSIAVPLTAAPALFGTLGINLATATTGTRVELSATVAVTTLLAVLGTVTILIFRDTTQIYSATTALPVNALDTLTFTVSATDFNVPTTPSFPIYTAYVLGSGINLATRTGPESFSAVAVSN
ncbi:hypothetical protein NQ117_04195 [Paenibacillus sp. SC116]|uniref:hypothetical protein n=1 Tax=Paenibacillus sp. SC116 TaxID=2968986 RepID=UPI00215AA27D|nr:hypothetical protein [Paenibacillus sp. SC116]MCR8842872.1 hypothetical protein [Paenibacillus sp. SC116]